MSLKEVPCCIQIISYIQITPQDDFISIPYARNSCESPLTPSFHCSLVFPRQIRFYNNKAATPTTATSATPAPSTLAAFGVAVAVLLVDVPAVLTAPPSTPFVLAVLEVAEAGAAVLEADFVVVP